jgi:sterol desaturase/sphingolipid hydroxylase (fatty acid hydroxylase superfamily)
LWTSLALGAGFALLFALEADGDAERSINRRRRWTTNFGLGAIGFAIAAMLPVSTLVAASWSRDAGFGLDAHLAMPAAVAFAVLLITRSFTAYWLHRAMHAHPLLWRLHRVHHADAELDVSSGVRNHPVEQLVGMAVAVAISAVLAPSSGVVLAVDALLLMTAFWQHADVRLPTRVASVAERLFVTPRYHRLHHDAAAGAASGNYGDMFTLWDRLFGTERHPDGADVVVGVADAPRDGLLVQLVAPLRR